VFEPPIDQAPELHRAIQASGKILSKRCILVNGYRKI
jgi:hypothetical protein